MRQESYCKWLYSSNMESLPNTGIASPPPHFILLFRAPQPFWLLSKIPERPLSDRLKKGVLPFFHKHSRRVFVRPGRRKPLRVDGTFQKFY